MKLVSLSTPVVLASAALADVGVVEATGAFQLGGASTTSYVSAIGASQNPRLNGFDFGSVNPLVAQSLLLQNWYFENYAYNGGNTPFGAATNNNWLDDNSVAVLQVTIKSGATMLSTRRYALYQTSASGNNRSWQLSGSAINLAAGLSDGSYSVEFMNIFDANQWTGSVSQFNTFTATSTASFTVIPAPGAVALVGLAGLIASRRRSN